MRFKYIDFIKGLGILLVIIGHHIKDANILINWIYSFHMPLFFIVSGFLFSDKFQNESIDIKSFIVKKAKSLMYPYFTLSIIVIIWHFLFYHVAFPNAVPEISTINVIFLTLSMYGYHAFWFIPCLFFSTILFALIYKRRKIHYIIFSISIITFLVHIIYGDFLKEIMPYVYKFVFRTSVAISFLYIGSIFQKVSKKNNKRFENLLFIISFVISGLVVGMNFLFPDSFSPCNLSVANIDSILLFYLTSISNSIWIFVAAKKLTSPNKCICFFGKNSLILLALHMDISIEIAYLIFSFLDVNISLFLLSIIVIGIEIIILCIFTWIINRFLSFIIKYPFSPRLCDETAKKAKIIQ